MATNKAKISTKYVSLFRDWIHGFDWRVRAIFLATFASLVISLIVAVSGINLTPSTFFGAAFASWVGGLAFFLLVGIFVAVASLVQPEDEDFNRRARILFGRQTGPHIDYIVSRLKELFEHYAESHAETVTIESYDKTEKKFRITAESITTIRAYIDDIESQYSTSIELYELTDPPKGSSYQNRISSVHVNEEPICVGEGIGSDGMKKEFQAVVKRAGKCVVEQRIEYWMSENIESNTFSTKRYTQSVTLNVRNMLPQSVTVQMFRDGAPTGKSYPIAPGRSQLLLSAREIGPAVEVYDFRLES